MAEEPTGEDAGCPPDSLVVSAVQDDLRWVFAVGTLPDYPDLGPQSCATLITANGNNGLGTGNLNLGPLGRVTLAGGGLDSGELAGYLVAGVAPPGTARVTIGTPEGDVVEAVLGDEGPRPGERLFGWFDEVPMAGDRRYGVTALDDAGTTLATARF